MIIFDTNVLSEVTKPTPDAGVLHWISSLSHEVATTAITSAELRAGISFLPEGQRKRELERVIDSQLNSFEDLGLVFPFDHEASIEYAIVLQSRKCVGRPIPRKTR